MTDDFGIDDFDAVDEAVMEVVAPVTGLKLGTITFAGPGHHKTVSLSHALRRRALHEDAQRRARPGWKPAERPINELDRENAQFVIDRIIRWAGIKMRNGNGHIEDIPFSEDAAMKLLNDPRRQWLMQQCVDFIVNQDSFFANLTNDILTIAEHEFRLDIPDKEGFSARTHLDALVKRGQIRKEVDHTFVDGEWVLLPEIPVAARYLFEWFADLNTDRRGSGYGPTSLSSSEILAWAQGKRIRLSVWEFDTLRRLDRAWMRAYADIHAPESTK